MRTMTTINWVRETLTTEDGFPLGTVHMGNRGSWSFQIRTSTGGRPQLMARCVDGRTVKRDHVSLRAAKNAALELLHPAERMGWSATGSTGLIVYRAQWDDLVFVVFRTEADTLAFQWRNTETGYKAPAAPVFGISEARGMAAAVLRDSYPTEAPAEAPKAVDGTLIGHLANALAVAGIVFTDEQLVKAADELASQR